MRRENDDDTDGMALAKENRMDPDSAGYRAANSSTWRCPTCGIAQPIPKRHPLGTSVKHAKHGKGKIFSYDHCDEVSCVVDFGSKGQWCVAIRELLVLQN